MNIAILIGNSTYENQSALPGCENDISLLEKILNSTGKYQEVITIVNKKSIDVKERLAKKISSLSGNAIDELFFYYTGHGLFRDDQFFFIPSDYLELKHHTTSFANNELDTLLKSLNPELTVKIVDACEATQTYIKMIDEEKEKYVSETKNKFKNCYFMFSSLSDQYSYQDKLLSSFTRSIVSALLEHDSASMRYADIIAYVADDFSDNKLQTPFFISQASFTEIFTDRLSAVKETIKANPYGILVEDSTLSSEMITEDIPEKISILDIVSVDAKNYIQKEIAINTVQQLMKDVLAIRITNSLNDIYDLSSESLKTTGSITGIQSVFDEIQGLRKDFFIEIKEEEESYTTEIEVPKKRNPNSAFAFATLDMFNTYIETETKTVTRKRMKMIGFDCSSGIPAAGFSIKLSPKYPNLNMYVLNQFFIFNKRQFLVYSNIVELSERDWKTWKVKEIGKWQKKELLFSDGISISTYIKDNIGFFQEYVLKSIEQKFGIEQKESRDLTTAST